MFSNLESKSIKLYYSLNTSPTNFPVWLLFRTLSLACVKCTRCKVPSSNGLPIWIFENSILPWTLTTELVHRNFHSICIDYSVLLVFRCGLGLELGLGQVMSPRPEWKPVAHIFSVSSIYVYSFVKISKRSRMNSNSASWGFTFNLLFQ